MKKIIALLLVLTLAMGLIACGTEKTPATTNAPETTEAPVETTEAPVETTGAAEETTGAAEETTEAVEAPEANAATNVLTAVWNAVDEETKGMMFVMGGDFSFPVDGAPGNYSLEDEGLTSTLLIPAEQVANVDAASSLMHAMMANNFTCGVFHVAEGADAAALAEAMKEAIAGNQWICGMPEKMLVAVIDGEYVLAAFGVNDAMNPFEAGLTAAYADADVKYSEAIAG